MFTNKLLCLSLVRLILKPKLNLRLTFLLHKQTFFFLIQLKLFINNLVHSYPYANLLQGCGSQSGPDHMRSFLHENGPANYKLRGAYTK